MPISGVDRLVSNLQSLAKVWDTPVAVRAGSDAIVKHGRRNVRQKLNRNARGVLENAVQTTIIDSRKAEAGVPANTLPYSLVHEFGATIYPKKAKALRFVIDGKVIFARSVTIPARPYMRPASKSSKRDVVKAVISETNKRMRELIK